MSQREFDREIPPDEQLREVSLILMQALYRLRRHGPPPRPPRVATPPAMPIRTDAAPRRRKQTLPKPRHAKQKAGTYANQLKNLFRKRRPQKRRWWMEMVVSLDTIPCDQLDRAVCRTHQDADDLEFREAFDHAMHVLSAEERRIAGLVAEHGITHAAREVGVSGRQIYNALARIRVALEEAGFEPFAHTVPHHTTR
jgi:hypothetical protein